MHRAHTLLVPVIAIAMSGCILKKTPVAKAAPPAPKSASAPTPAPPPEPLSAQQTVVQLPPPQPVSQEAALTAQPPEETPVPAPPARTGNRPQRQNPAATLPKPEPAPPPVVAPPAAPVESERMPLQEVLAPAEVKRLQDEANGRKTEARRLVDQARRRHLSRQQIGIVERIQSFIKQADDAERRGEMRQASELAERALVLARELKP
jgi:hypothetical protein